MLVGANGNVNSIRDYDASGQIMLKAPDIDKDRDPFGFIGGLNSGNGLWKLGARFYDSGKNSFIQQDRYMGDVNDPLSLNRYVYCGMDPVNNVDPSGFSAIFIGSSPYEQRVVASFDQWLQTNYPGVKAILDKIDSALSINVPRNMMLGIVPFGPFKSGELVNGMKMSTNGALEAAGNFLEDGYKDLGNGRFLSADGLRQVRMGDSDILGQHGSGAHMNFETLAPNPSKPGKMQIINDIHIYLED